MARIAIVGVGGVGGFVAAELAAAGHDVDLCVRTPFDALEVTSAGATTTVPARVVRDPGDLAPADWVVLATKAHHVPAVGPWLAAACGAGTAGVVVAQNGLDHAARVAPVLPDGTDVAVVASVVLIGGEAVGPGVVVHTGGTSLVVPDDERGRAAAAALAGAPRLRVEAAADFEHRVWHKLVMNATAGPVTVLTRRRLDVFADPEVADLARRLAAEVVAVAAADGVDLPASTPSDVVAALASQGEVMGTSMLADRLAGRPTEVEVLLDPVLDRAARHHLEVPVCRAVTALVRAGEPPAA